jgi:hypothetical protein
MTYEKPEVVMVAPACAAVQNGAKKPSPYPDTLPEQTTVGAYDADE